MPFAESRCSLDWAKGTVSVQQRNALICVGALVVATCKSNIINDLSGGPTGNQPVLDIRRESESRGGVRRKSLQSNNMRLTLAARDLEAVCVRALAATGFCKEGLSDFTNPHSTVDVGCIEVISVEA
jgi:hypothetical protein